MVDETKYGDRYTLGGVAYRDIEGDPCTLYQLIVKDPGWAQSRIRECERLEARFIHSKEQVTINGQRHYVQQPVIDYIAELESKNAELLDEIKGEFRG